MGRLLCLMLLCLAPGRAGADPLWLDRPDLHAHFWLSYGASLTLTEILEGPQPAWGPQLGTTWAVLAATAAVGALGMAKELTDDRVDGGDLLADGLGLTSNVALQFAIRF